MSAVHLSYAKSHGRAVNPRPLSAALLIASLTVALAACTVLVAPILTTAFKMALQGKRPTIAQCTALPADAERLACFDELSKQARRPPAKGANAPLIAR